MQAMVTLSSEESKRLIAKAVAASSQVQKALREGIIGFSLCTSAGYVIQELLGKDAVNPAVYASGFIYSGGSCCVPAKHQAKLLVLEKGREHWLNFPEENILQFINRMDHNDIIVKSGNLMDPSGNVGVLLASPGGGEAGQYLPHIMAKGIKFIVPMTINKTVPIALSDILPYMGISKFRRNRVHGMSCGMLPLPGKVITEIEALRALYGVKAVPAAMDGVGSGAGSVTLVLAGEDDDVETAWEALNRIKGEPKLRNYFSTCLSCNDAKEESRGGQCSTKMKQGDSKRRL